MALNTVTYMFLGLSGWALGSTFTVITQPNSDNTTVLDYILGPFGALALSVVIIYILGRYMAKLIKRNDQLQEDRMKEYRDRIKDLERGNNKD